MDFATRSIMIVACFLLFVFSASAQKMDSLSCSDKCVEYAMAEIPSEFIFLKKFIANKRGCSKQETTFLLSKGETYWFGFSGPSGSVKGIAGTLYYNDRKRAASNYYYRQFKNGFLFKCRASGLYYFTITFINYSYLCKEYPTHKWHGFLGAAVLAVKR